METFLDFGEIERCEEIIRETWADFRQSLAKGLFTFEEIDQAKKQTFLKTYDDLFNQHSGIRHNTKTVGNLKDYSLGRGVRLKDLKTPDYDRFIPKKEFIREDNRFSPPGTEWLYLSLGKEEDIHRCAAEECRMKKGDQFGFCHFQLDPKYYDCKLVDLTISDNLSYTELNHELHKQAKSIISKSVKLARVLGGVSQKYNYNSKFKNAFTQWSAYTHTKLLSEQIFLPLDSTDNKAIIYAPFQTMAQYYISLGYSGIIYKSTVCPVGKNLVLFNKHMASPTGNVENYRI